MKCFRLRSGVCSWSSHATVGICSVYLKDVNRQRVVYTELLRPRALRRSGPLHFVCVCVCVFKPTIMT